MQGTLQLFLSTLGLSLLPGFEGRYSYAYGLVRGLPPTLSLFSSLLGVLILSLILPYLIDSLDSFAQNTSLPLVKRVYERVVIRTRRKAEPYVSKYGFLGLVLFVAVPLPGTGVWTGTLAAYLLGIHGKKLLLSLFLGGMLSIMIVAFLGLTYNKIQ